MILDAIEHSSTFNLIHLKTMIKVDIFIPGDTSYENETFRRKKLDSFPEEKTALFFCSSEDIIINKLNWYKKGNMVSERQWTDIIGVVRVQYKSLDLEYLKKWTKQLGLEELLTKCFHDAGYRI